MKYGTKVGRDHLVPVLRRMVSGGCTPDDACIVDENLERAEFSDGLLDKRSTNARIGEIPGKISRFPPERADLLRNFTRIRAAAVASYIRPGLGKRRGD